MPDSKLPLTMSSKAVDARKLLLAAQALIRSVIVMQRLVPFSVVLSGECTTTTVERTDKGSFICMRTHMTFDLGKKKLAKIILTSLVTHD